MQLALDFNDVDHLISAYGTGHVVIGQRRIESSVVVTASRLAPDWPPRRFEDLDEAHFRSIAAIEPRPGMVIVGTGARHRFPPAGVLRPLVELGIPVEVMSTGAACRTYNVIAAEGRRVAAALLMI